MWKFWNTFVGIQNGAKFEISSVVLSFSGKMPVKPLKNPKWRKNLYCKLRIYIIQAFYSSKFVKLTQKPEKRPKSSNSRLWQKIIFFYEIFVWNFDFQLVFN